MSSVCASSRPSRAGEVTEVLPDGQGGRGEDPRAAARLHQCPEALRDIKRDQAEREPAGPAFHGARTVELVQRADARQGSRATSAARSANCASGLSSPAPASAACTAYSALPQIAHARNSSAEAPLGPRITPRRLGAVARRRSSASSASASAAAGAAPGPARSRVGRVHAELARAAPSAASPAAGCPRARRRTAWRDRESGAPHRARPHRPTRAGRRSRPP